MAVKLKADEEVKKPSLRERISNFLNGTSAADASETEAAKADDEEDDTSMTAADDDSEDTEAAADYSDDENDPDDDGDDDTDPDKDDDDDMDVNGTVVNLKDPAAVRAAIDSLLATNAEQKELLTEAAAELAKTKTEVKNEIKSTFVPKGSSRSTKINVKDDGVPDVFKPEENSIAANVLRSTIAKAKASKKS